MTHRMQLLLLSLATLLALTACSTLKVESWTDPAFADRPMGKVMVVGVTESESLQRQYEGLFVAGLARAGVDAVPSGDHFPVGAKVPKEDLQAQLTKEGVASLLVTRVIGEEDKAQYYPPVSFPTYYGGHFGYYSRAFDYAHSPGYLDVYVEIHLETNLYDVETGKLVWSGRKKITDERSDKKNMEQVINATIKDLQKNGLL